MNEWERPGERGASQVVAKPAEQLALYDRYSSMAYGIILQILPQTEQAQEVLIEMFSSPDLQRCVNSPGNTAVAIVRLARTKALEAKARLQGPLPQPIEAGTAAKGSLPEVVFELAFRQSCSIETITEKLQLPKADVLKAIHDYFVSFRQA